ncbi:amidohydrolase family protein [Pikeienuella sp. HZG-20]|uniref:amidohydrolase family protein n=1 Tax=Paludibacillus litoralis TaxID=3133267 RepID=UPI0030EC84B8
MNTFETLFVNAKMTDGRLVDIAVEKGAIAAIVESGDARPKAGATVDLSGALVVPGFVEGHIHLDTSFYGDDWRPHKPCESGFNVHERVRFQAENLALAAPLRTRARDQLDLCLAQGSTRMRSHVMVDAELGLRHVEAVLELRDACRDLIDLQLVAFPQSGVLASVGTAALLDEAVAMGCEVVGGIDPASFDRDVEGHLAAIFDIAARRGAAVDIHLHDRGELGCFEIERIAAWTERLGLEGRVAVSHAYALGDASAERLAPLAETLARSGVAIMTAAPGVFAVPPVAALRAAGVTVFSGNDNIRDSWSPYGDGDMLRRAMILGYRSGFKTDEELLMALDVVTAGGAAALGLEDYGIRVGAAADFTTLNARHGPEAVVAVPQGRDVYRKGRLVARNGALAAAPAG